MRKPLPALLAVLLAAPAAADWSVPVKPPTPPSRPLPGTRPPTTAEGEFSSGDRTAFDEKHKDGIFERLCGRASIGEDFKAGDMLNDKLRGTGFSIGGTFAEVQRKLDTYPDRTHALVDRVGLNLHAGYGYGRSLGAGIGGSISVGASFSGFSEVVRPLATKQACPQIPRMLNPADVKLAFPLTAERIQKMELGELWRTPFSLGISGSAGASFSEAGVASVGVSVGHSESGSANLTLYRMDHDKLRMRFRVNQIKSRSISGSVSAVISPFKYAAPVENFLVDLGERELNRQVNKYLSAVLSMGASKSEGQQLLLEFVIDPRDEAQAEAMAEALRGNFMELIGLGVRIGTLRASNDSVREFYGDLREKNSKILGPAAYSAIEAHAQRAASINAKLLAAAELSASQVSCDNNIRRIDGADGQFRFHCSDKSQAQQYLGVPFLGWLVKTSEQERADTVNFAPEGEAFDATRLVYLHNDGFVRVNARHAAFKMNQLNLMLGLAGAQVGAAPNRLAIDPALVLPPLPYPASEADRRGRISVNLVFNQQAVQRIAATGDAAVLAALRGVTSPAWQRYADWLAQNARFDGKRLSYDGNAAQAAFGTVKRAELERIAEEGGALLADFAKLRSAGSHDERARKLRDMLARSPMPLGALDYGQTLGVLIQLVDPMELTGDFMSSVEGHDAKGRKIGKNVHLVLKSGREEVPGLKEAGQTRTRFQTPSRLLD